MQLGRSNKSIISQHVFIKLQSIKFSIPVGRQAYVVKISQLLLICSHHHTIISCFTVYMHKSLQFTYTNIYKFLRQFHCNSMRRRLMGTAKEISTFHNWSLFIDSRYRYMDEILLKRLKPYSINQSIDPQ